MLTPYALAAVVSSLTSNTRTTRLGPRVIALGAALVTVGLGVSLLLLHATTSITALAASLLIAGLGHGLIVPPNVNLGLRDVPRGIVGGAGGAINIAQRIGQIVGVSVLGGLFLHTVAGPNDYSHALVITLAIELVGSIAVGGSAFLIPQRAPAVINR